ncbi:MAG: hypothetical protein ABI441_09915 [Flavobacterium sp.]
MDYIETDCNVTDLKSNEIIEISGGGFFETMGEMAHRAYHSVEHYLYRNDFGSMRSAG